MLKLRKENLKKKLQLKKNVLKQKKLWEFFFYKEKDGACVCVNEI